MGKEVEVSLSLGVECRAASQSLFAVFRLFDRPTVCTRDLAASTEDQLGGAPVSQTFSWTLRVDAELVRVLRTEPLLIEVRRISKWDEVDEASGSVTTHEWLL